MRKKMIVLMALTFMFIITGCKNIATIDGKTDMPVVEDDNTDSKDYKNGGDCGPNDEGGLSVIYDKGDVSMKTEQESYSSDVEDITITINNATSNDYYYGEEFSLEQEVEGQWVLISPKEEIFVITIANILEGNGSKSIIIPLSYYEKLSDGHYRIVKNVIKEGNHNTDAETENLLLAAEFNISSDRTDAQNDKSLAAVYVALEKEIYSDKKDVVKYTIVNNTKETKNVVLAPRLEKEVGDEWELVKGEMFFCGTPDAIKDEIEGEINLEWYPSISDGVYRLSFDVEDKGEATPISVLFTFKKEHGNTTDANNNDIGLGDAPDSLNITKYTTVNNLNGLNMIIKKDSLSSDGLTLMFQNKSENTCIYGEQYVLEMKIDGQWYEVPVTIDGNYGFDDIGYEVVSNEEKELNVDWKWLYGSLEMGDYRIVKEISDIRKTRDYNIFNMAAEFTID